VPEHVVRLEKINDDVPHGIVSFLKGSCSWALVVWLRYRRNAEDEAKNIYLIVATEKANTIEVMTERAQKRKRGDRKSRNYYIFRIS
jgi:hypothetical protein